MACGNNEYAGTYPFNEKSIFLVELCADAHIYLSKGLDLPPYIKREIVGLEQTILLKSAEGIIQERNMRTMATEVETFWDQVYAYAFLNHGVPVPPAKLFDLSKDRSRPIGIAGIPEQQKAPLEYFATLVRRFSSSMPVSESVRRRLQFIEDARSGEADMSEREVAACNCPYCWVYMEDLAKYMDHLWTHAVDGEQSKESEVKEDEGVVNDVRRSDHEMTVRETGNEEKRREEELQERKDSGYEGTMPLMGPSQNPVDQSPTSTASQGATGQTQSMTSATLAGKNTDDSAASSHSFDIGFWRGLLQLPIARAFQTSQGQTDISFGGHGGGAHRALYERDRAAQVVRSNMKSIWWFDPYKRENNPFQRPLCRHVQASRRMDAGQVYQGRDSDPSDEGLTSSISNFAKQGQASRSDWSSSAYLVKPSDTELANISAPLGDQRHWPRSPFSDGRDDDRAGVGMSAGSSPDASSAPMSYGEGRYWVCAHATDCRREFDSLVLYVEHLSRHGYVVYKKWTELHPRASPDALQEARTTWGCGL
ncbi:uncharacterized protein PV09_06933 [Verruconis gallopava]|uniref:Uncharacterized protein n=1 Tax=Verruconis gallopava TaxID=253628 RepID=A0A0D1YLN9_9PEZI|nr:uncharacterized protein PV09_06933 [Verruconis gallopava]KIW01757.1 hypothetical protein PV09_06933 [Verruconis gallopava]